MTQKLRVCVIGAGASGLPTAKWALEYGHEVVVFEAQSSLGGLWNYKPEETEFSTVMKSTVINTSKEMTAYSDFPPPAEDANYMHNRKLLKYLTDYAKEFGVAERIRFRHRVKNVCRASDYALTGRWDVHYVDDNENPKTETFDLVAVTVGHHATPNMPSYPGQDRFRGQIIHSHSYKHHVGYEDKTVLVVGFGNSAMDVACELSRVANDVYISTRRGAWVLPKTVDDGYPMDLWFNSRANMWLKKYAFSYFVSLAHRRVNRIFDHNVYGAQPKHTIMQQHPTLTDELHGKVTCGTVVIKGDVKEFDERSVLFHDGQRIDVDAVVMATGYSFEFPFLESGKLIPVVRNVCPMYRKMFPLGSADKNTLAIIGNVQPVGSIMPIAEMQARFFFSVHAGQIRLPSKAEMEMATEQMEAARRRRFVDSPRHTVQVDYSEYMTELSDEVGCTPQPFRYLLSDPSLFWTLAAGPDAPYAYRLRGPHAHPRARDMLFGIERRRIAATRKRETGVQPTTDWWVVAEWSAWLALIAALIGVGVAVGVVAGC